MDTAREEGFEEGHEEGKFEEKITIARTMKQKGFSTSDIADITKLSLEEVDKL